MNQTSSRAGFHFADDPESVFAYLQSRLAPEPNVPVPAFARSPACDEP